MSKLSRMRNFIICFQFISCYNIGKPVIEIDSENGFGFSVDHLETEPGKFISIVGNPYENAGEGRRNILEFRDSSKD